ncbi:MAG: MerC family mercury resistance protein [Luteitalea sp.]|nr:MerC family mercury resistance protein [Luteitalea sp.]
MQRSAFFYHPSSSVSVRDRAGIATALLCAVHCGLLPLGAGLLSAIGLDMLLTDGVELALLMLAGVIGVWSLWPAFQHRHRRLLPLLIFLAGLLVMSVARVLEHVSASLELSLVVVGAAAIATAHVKNLCLCQRCAVCEDD